MLLIVAHHYVVNSGLLDVGGPIWTNLMSPKSLFLLVFGAWGKTGINAFVLITGYFMCTSNITLRKYVKLLGEVIFYKIMIYFIFVITGYQVFSIESFFLGCFPITSVTQGFTSCFLIFYLCIPFVNILIRGLNEKQHVYLMLLLLFTYTFFGTIKLLPVHMNYVSWFVVIYILAAYIRMYPKELFQNIKFWKWAMICSIMISVASVLAGVWFGTSKSAGDVYFFVTDSNTLLAVTTALSTFMYFNNLKIANNKLINMVAASAYGVLLIHANSDTMRQWLWRDVLRNVEFYASKYLILHAVLSVVIIYVICTIIDYLRIRTVERFFLKIWDKYEQKLVSAYKRVEAIICKRCK